MYTATVSPGAAGDSLRNLINTAVPGEIPATFNGRCFYVSLLALTGTPSIVSRTGGPVANNPVALSAAATGVPLVITCPTGNQISIDEIFLVGAASTVGVTIFVM